MGTFAITGGATGIGAAIKEQLKEAGHSVIVVDIKDADIIADLSTAAGRNSAVAGIQRAATDGLEGFVPCAGLGPAVTPPSLCTRVNFFGVLATVAGVKDLVAMKRGAILLISSNSAPMGADPDSVAAMLAGNEEQACEIVDRIGDGQNAYGGSKLALTRWMRANSQAYALAGVRINAVAPGFTQTPLTDKVLEDEVLGQVTADFADTIPLGRRGQPVDIANVATFLLSEKASFMAGSVVFVDGGHDAMLRPDQF